MVDFNELLGRQPPKASIDPVEIFQRSDRKSGRDYLRPPQEAVLKEWHSSRRANKEVIVKLHTGQGKTLIGLLMLQSLLNELRQPVLYLCPTSFLVSQTCNQGDEFGIATVQIAEDSAALPREFLNSQRILVTTCKKLFNGKSVFGVVGHAAEPVACGAILMDDAHKCLEEIRSAYSIRVPRKLESIGRPHPVYQELLNTFADSLQRQAAGTFQDIQEGSPESFLAVPYWSWRERQADVQRILGEHKEEEGLLFSWDLIKNGLQNCTCVISASGIEITPRLVPLHLIPSFVNATRKIYLTATLTEDSFLVRDLGLDPVTVLNPLSTGDVQFSGERLIVLPSLVNNKLDRGRIISWLTEFSRKTKGAGFATIVPSRFRAEDWRKSGAMVTDVGSLEEFIRKQAAEVARKASGPPLVLLNAYDGVDLPDDICRVLCLDSLPSYSSATDRYLQEARPSSKISKRQRAQRVEQGLGRAIRGTGDWCVVVAIGNDLTSFLSENSKSEFLSNEVRQQIAIGEELADQLKKEGQDLHVVQKLIQQCLDRNEGWKAFYRDRMSKVASEPPNPEFARRAEAERQAEALFQGGHVQKALEAVDRLIADCSNPSDRGWYLQTKAFYLFDTDRPRSMEVQLKSRTENPALFMPPAGIAYAKISPAGADRAKRILEIVKAQDQWNSMLVALDTVLDKLVFGAPADSFEEGIDDLGKLLGFVTQRPDHEFHKGPDNLWSVGGTSYWLLESKNMVAKDRTEISKGETEQIGSSVAWFSETYEGDSGLPIMIHPARTLAADAFKTTHFAVIQPDQLDSLKQHVRTFYRSMSKYEFEKLSEEQVAAMMAACAVTPKDLQDKFTVRVKETKGKKL